MLRLLQYCIIIWPLIFKKPRTSNIQLFKQDKKAPMDFNHQRFCSKNTYTVVNRLEGNAISVFFFLPQNQYTSAPTKDASRTTSKVPTYDLLSVAVSAMLLLHQNCKT